MIEIKLKKTHAIIIKLSNVGRKVLENMAYYLIMWSNGTRVMMKCFFFFEDVPCFPSIAMESEQWLKWIDNQCEEERSGNALTQFIGGTLLGFLYIYIYNKDFYNFVSNL